MRVHHTCGSSFDVACHQCHTDFGDSDGVGIGYSGGKSAERHLELRDAHDLS
jgi:hypothetical protein